MTACCFPSLISMIFQVMPTVFVHCCIFPISLFYRLTYWCKGQNAWEGDYSSLVYARQSQEPDTLLGLALWMTGIQVPGCLPGTSGGSWLESTDSLGFESDTLTWLNPLTRTARSHTLLLWKQLRTGGTIYCDRHLRLRKKVKFPPHNNFKHIFNNLKFKSNYSFVC